MPAFSTCSYLVALVSAIPKLRNLGNVLTTTANGLPTNGSTVYVTLYSLVGGQWLSNAYTTFRVRKRNKSSVVA